MVFNVLTDNKDDHLKNFSFICREGKWSLAPAYDLTLCSLHSSIFPETYIAPTIAPMERTNVTFYLSISYIFLLAIYRSKCKQNGLPDYEKSDSPVNLKTIPMKHCVLFQIKF